MPDTSWYSIDGALKATRFATDDTDGMFLWTPPSMGAQFPRPVRQWFGVMDWAVQNRTGGQAIVGFGVHLDPSTWQAGTWTNATTTYVDNTAAAKGTSGSLFQSETTTTADGHVIACTDKFNVVGYVNGTLSSGGGGAGAGTVRVVEYSIAGGTWGSVPVPFIGPVSGGNWTVVERACCWPLPSDFAPLEAGHGTGVPVGYYGIRVRQTGTITASAAFSRIVLGRMQITDSVASQGILSQGFEVEDTLVGAHLAFLVSRDLATVSVALTTGSNAKAKVRLRG